MEVLSELQLFSGGAAILQSRERDLRTLRQTGVRLGYCLSDYNSVL